MKSDCVTISVIITNYNYAIYLNKAIDSVLGQTRPADEIIVVDDGSTDGSREIILSYGDIVRAIFQKNEGIKAVSNRGFAEARGNIVMYLDADDVLYAEALGQVEAAIRPGVAKVQFDLDIINSQGELLGRRYCNFSGPVTEDETSKEFARTGTYLWPVTSGNAYAREFLDRVMPLTPPVSLDGVLNTIAPLYGKVVTIIRPLGQLRQHSRNISRVDDKGRINNIPDFALRIRLRKLEFDVLRQHAKRIGKSLPDIDFLDNELVFVNYRMMARKLKWEEAGDSQRPLTELWRNGVRLALRSPFHWLTSLKHIIWLTSLALAPASLAQAMIFKRFTQSKSLVRPLR